jgi:hypothetical protein
VAKLVAEVRQLGEFQTRIRRQIPVFMPTDLREARRLAAREGEKQ